MRNAALSKPPFFSTFLPASWGLLMGMLISTGNDALRLVKVLNRLCRETCQETLETLAFFVDPHRC